jgi:hypothetical protein
MLDCWLREMARAPAEAALFVDRMISPLIPGKKE